jgi:DNA-binding MarR family transcriptional regulator
MHDGEREQMTDGDLERLDHALLKLRRMWDAPAGIEHEGRIVDGSTLLVCLAVEEHRVAESDGGVLEVGVLEVATALGVAHSTASRLVSRAVEAGMAARQRSVADPRRVSLELTADGGRLVGAARAFRTARLDAALAPWPRADVRALAELLDRFADLMTQGPGTRRR